ncbi:MAG TPA: DUF2905 domain-containing protein [Firmicutes bacterium]|nr:DUF2905 domain-containing protein [Candidatus Fermentithermobacillaceae bacterium]
MLGFSDFGRILMVFGVILLVLGAFLTFSGRFFSLGRLPGDILIRRGNFTFYFPLASSLLLSIVLTLVLWLAARGR